LTQAKKTLITTAKHFDPLHFAAKANAISFGMQLSTDYTTDKLQAQKTVNLHHKSILMWYEICF